MTSGLANFQPGSTPVASICARVAQSSGNWLISTSAMSSSETTYGSANSELLVQAAIAVGASSLLAKNKDGVVADALAAVKQTHYDVNEASFTNAFYTQKRKLTGGTKTTAKRKKPRKGGGKRTQNGEVAVATA